MKYTGLLLALLLILSSCNFSDEPAEEFTFFDSRELSGNCELDTSKLHDILKKDIARDIECLKENLKSFVDFVNRAEENYVSHSELHAFIKKFFPDNFEKVQRILKLAFDLNSLLLKDPARKLSLRNIDPLFEILHVANREGSMLYSELKGMDKFSYWHKREKLNHLFKITAWKIHNIIKSRTANPNTLNISTFLAELKDILELGEADFDIDLIESFLFIKKLTLGGENTVLTSFEAENLFAKAPKLLTVGMDIIYSDAKKNVKPGDLPKFYLSTLKGIKSLLHDWGVTEFIIHHDDLEKVVQKLIGTDYVMENMEKSLKNFKRNFIGGDDSVYRFGDFISLYELALDVAETFYFNEITFDHYKKELQGPGPIEIEIPNLEAYNSFSHPRILNLWENFTYILKRYQFFSDKSGLPYYTNHIRRHIEGFNTVTMLRWAVKKLFETYGHLSQSGQPVINGDELHNLLYDYQGFLVEVKIWPKDIPRFISEAQFSSDLFQFQSNGDGNIGIDEATEYFNNILSAYTVKDQVIAHLATHCEPYEEDDGELSFDLTCYRNNFYNVLFEDAGYEFNYQKLHQYWENNKFGGKSYLKNVESYARIVPDEKLPMTETDISRLLISLANIESTIIKYDINHDNKLKIDELDSAVGRFEKTIVDLGDLKGKEQFARSVFLYLIKKMEVPGQFKLLLFHFFGKKKDIVGTRENIGAILSFFVDQ